MLHVQCMTYERTPGINGQVAVMVGGCEAFSVERGGGGWMVRTIGGGFVSHPYPEKKHAVAFALGLAIIDEDDSSYEVTKIKS